MYSGKGALFINTQRYSEKQPDFTGRCSVINTNGAKDDMYLVGFKRESKVDGGDFIFVIAKRPVYDDSGKLHQYDDFTTGLNYKEDGAMSGVMVYDGVELVIVARAVNDKHGQPMLKLFINEKKYIDSKVLLTTSTPLKTEFEVITERYDGMIAKQELMIKEHKDDKVKVNEIKDKIKSLISDKEERLANISK